jgi:hypothetical protein
LAKGSFREGKETKAQSMGDAESISGRLAMALWS